ncbi:MAG: hypothetical protein PWR24_924 [Desulfonauticus sp.]|jgi:hypothetical protein|nr:MAG: Uncharacterized protein XD41_0048 [Desulfonauticus sp. 38_4375]MDK2921367.1 hypothetical protein [Desulfonauticus sp.]
MQTIIELLTNMTHSTTEGKFGVAAIFIYFIIIVAVACYRIKENLKHEHH